MYIAYQWIFRRRTKRTAVEFYAALQRWGRYSGLSHVPTETPMEYGRRLAHQFPLFKAEITWIIDMLHWEVYGEWVLSSNQIQHTRQAWKKLHSPRRWPIRIKSMMTGLQ
jgi:hypothetical protein